MLTFQCPFFAARRTGRFTSLFCIFLFTASAFAADSVQILRIGPVLDEAFPAVTDTLKVKLTSQPPVGQVVVINLGSDTAAGVTLSASTLTFTNANWNVNQSVTITPVDDAVIENVLQSTSIALTIDTAATTFDAYDIVTIPSQTVRIYDNDGPVTVSRSYRILDEAFPAVTQTLKVRINTQPPAGQVVVIDLGSDTAQGLTLSSSTLTFANADWNVFQTVTVMAVDDAIIEAPTHKSDVTLTVDQVATTFNSFDAVTIPSQTFSIYDNDGPVTVFHTGPTLDEANPADSDTLKVRINSQPPAGQVVVINLASDTVQGVTLSTPSLTFTNADWSTFQDVTVTAIDDAVVEAAIHQSDVTLTVDQAATTFDAFDPTVIPLVTFSIADNDLPITVWVNSLILTEATPAITRTMQVRINQQPPAGQVVVIDLASDTVTGVTVSQNTLTFDNTNWSTFQMVTVTVVDDKVIEASTHLSDVTLTVNQAATTFNAFDSVTIAPVTFSIKENEYGIQLSTAALTYNTTPGVNPTNQTATLTRTGMNTATLVWTASVTKPWFQVTAASGTTKTEIDTLHIKALATQAEAWTTATSLTGAPTARNYHSAVWTGSEMIVWGGTPTGSTGLNTGGRYNPATNTWSAMSTANAPTARLYHTAVWTGSEMIVWGGYDGATAINTGGRYNPATDTWSATALATTNAPSARNQASAVWTGSEMIVWGGNNGTGIVNNTGRRYDPASNTWSAIALSTTNAPSARYAHSAVWTGSEMVVWGGANGSGGPGQINTGGRYNPATDTWSATAISPSARFVHSAVWTGSEMIVWGGADVFTPLNSGVRYNPATDTWSPTPVSTTNAPAARYSQSAVWTGLEMIVWGGSNGTFLNDGMRYKPPISLPAGIYTDTLTVSDPNATNNPQRIALTLNVNSPATGIGLSTNSVTITPAVDSTTPTLLLANTGPGTMNWTVTSNQPWLIPTPASGATVNGTPATLALKYYFITLPKGVYTATLTVTSPSATNSPQTINVTMNVDDINKFESTAVYLRTLNVNPAGNDATADGTLALPFKTLRGACLVAKPGDIIQLSAGTFTGDGSQLYLSGTYLHPIKIQGDPAGGTIFSGGTNGIHITSPKFLTIQDLVLTGFSDKGINLDAVFDGSPRGHHAVIRRVKGLDGTTPTNHMVLRTLNTDCVLMENCEISVAFVSAAGGAILHQNTFHSIVRNCYLHDTGSNCIRLITQCEDCLLFANKLENTINNGLYLNGFRNNAISNLCINVFVPLRFENAEESLAANNTVYRARQYCLWFSAVADPFATKNGRIINNIFLFNNPELTNYCNNGGAAFPATFQYKNNAWYSLSNPAFAGPTNTAVAEISPLYQVNPQFASIAAGNYHLLTASGLRGNGLTLPEAPVDFDGAAFANPRARGCYEGQPVWLALSQKQIFFQGQEGGGTLTMGTALTNSGTGTSNWSATCNQPWLGVSPSSGTMTTGPQNLAVSANLTGLTPGGYRGLVTVSDPASANGNVVAKANLGVFRAPYATLDFEWAKSAGGSGGERAQAIAVDSVGNSYITGFCGPNAAFGASGIINAAGAHNEAFVAKLDSAGNFLWASAVSSTVSSEGLSIAVDATGHVYVAGDFVGTATFGSLAPVVGAGGADGFVARLDSSGNFAWVQSIGGSTDDKAYAVCVDATGNFTVAGIYTGTCNFGGFSSLTTPALYSTFILKFDAAGAFQWIRSFASAASTAKCAPFSMSQDVEGSSYLTGLFLGANTFADFGSVTSTTVTNTITSYNVFIAKLTAAGHCEWALQAGGEGSIGYGIAVDYMGNSYITGSGSGTFGATSLTGSLFVAKITGIGAWAWARSGSTSTGALAAGRAITIDSAGEPTVAGWFGNTTYSFGAAGARTSSGLLDIFVTKLDQAGNFRCASRAGSTAEDVGLAIAADPAGHIYVAGYDSAAASFAPANTLTALGGNDIFVARMNFSVPAINLNPSTLNFTAAIGYGDPASQTSTVTSTGTPNSVVNWTAVPDQPWITVSPASGATTGGTSVISVQPSLPGTEQWLGATSLTGAPSVREAATAVWTGTEMIVWGGGDNAVYGDGGIYSPASNSWRSISTVGAPVVFKHAAIWTGSTMIVWGGSSPSAAYLNAGAIYNPTTDTWAPMTSINAPTARRHPATVWTGSEMIVWGGDDGTFANTGGRYNPATNAWSTNPMSTVNAPTGRFGHSAVWTGTEMIVWGGFSGGPALDTGGSYNPATNTWSATPTSTTNAPTARYHHTAVWDGGRMIIWGGSSDVNTRLNTGAFYDPATNTWTGDTTLTGAPIVRHAHVGVWTGSTMIVWGGWWGADVSGHVRLNDGGIYRPAWTPAAGTYTGHVWVNDPAATNNPQSILVTLTVEPHDPQVTAMSPAPGATSTSSPPQITLDFNRDLDVTTISPQSITLVRSGGDGTFADGNEVAITPDGVSATGPKQATIDLSSVTLPADTYRVTAFSTNSAQRALTFDGVNDRVVIPNSASLNPATAMTVECWVYVAAGGDGTPRMVSKGTDSYELYTVGTTANRKFGFRVGTQLLTTTGMYAIGSWHHVAATFDASNTVIYVDGVQDATMATTGSLVTNTKTLTFGRISGNTTNNFNGTLDEVRLWNVARTQAQIQTDMNHNLAGNEAGLTGYWHMNELSGQTVTDSTSSANNGTLGGTSAVSTDDPTRATSGADIKGVLDALGNPLDGEFSGALPSGNGTPGGDFQATFTQQ